MKKILFVVILVCAGMAANAQFFIGGSLGAGIASTNNDNGDKVKTTMNYSIHPDFGYSFNKYLDLGITAGYGITLEKLEGDNDFTTGGSYTVSPYLRCRLVEFGRFKVMAKATLYLSGTTGDLGYKTFNTGLNISPVLGYNLSNHFILLADLNVFNLGFGYSKIKDGDGTVKFNLGADSNNVMNTGSIKIGFAYIF